VHQARFVLVPAAGGAACEALRDSFAGTLEEPWRGATLILEVSRLSEGGEVLLEGPGIASRSALGVEGLETGWLSLRAERCAEYPLGLDLILVDRDGRLAALPRTCRAWREA
jgi:alpha-D-ribose 1-methylphosphonate 5-triphosphate synthase subunit PhnH